MKFKQYLNEEYEKKDVTKDISFDELMKIAPQYSDAIKGAIKGKKSRMIRGIRGYKSNSPYTTIDPSAFGERKSAYTMNYYTLIMNNAPNWEKYPKRAIVASNDIDKAQGYSGKNLFMVLPKNGSYIAQLEVDDIWSAFPDLYSTLDGLNDDIQECFEKFNIKRSDDNYIEFVKACKNFDEKLKIDRDRSIFEETTITEYFEDTIQVRNSDLFGKYYDGNFMEMLQIILDPKKGDVSLVKAGQDLNIYAEVWTDSKCLLIKYYDFVEKSDEMRQLAKSLGLKI